MFSVFSNTKMKPSEQVRLLQQCAGADLNRMLIAGSEDEPLWVLKTHETRKWLTWINRKILFILPDANMRTISVRVRIATGMLNNLETSGSIPKDICIQYHERLTKNVRELLGKILTEDLPF